MNRYWLSFDLGIDGDYDSLYRWLDGIGAVECGDGFCSFLLATPNFDPPTAVLAIMRENHVNLRKRDRIYLIWRKPEGGVKGKFITGLRRRAPWSGYAVGPEGEESEG